jgi:hypothetical protein
MPRARKPFKSFNRNQYIFAVQLTEDNIDDVAQRIGGRVRETDTGLVLRVKSEEFTDDSKAVVGQYIVVTSIDDATGNYAYGVMDEAQFEEDWIVPKPGAKETDEDEESSEG